MTDKDILTPMRTTINDEPAEWTPEIWAKWHTVADDADPKYTGERVTSANYYTPRPYVDEYNRGSREEGFTYIMGRRVHQVVVSWSAVIERAPRGRP